MQRILCVCILFKNEKKKMKIGLFLEMNPN